MGQLKIPQVSDTINDETEDEVSSPQPRVEEYRSIRKYEIDHRPLDLKFRGRIHLWLVKLQEEDEIIFGDLLNIRQMMIIYYYFFPQSEENKWINQDEVMELVNMNSKRKLRDLIKDSLHKIWEKDRSSS